MNQQIIDRVFELTLNNQYLNKHLEYITESLETADKNPKAQIYGMPAITLSFTIEDIKRFKRIIQIVVAENEKALKDL